MIILEDLEYLEKLLKKEKNVKVKSRIHFLYLNKINPNYQQKELCQILGLKRNCLRVWTKNYELNGLDNFLKVDKPPGRKAKLDNDNLLKLQDKLKDSEGFVSVDSIRQWIKLELGIELTYRQTHHATSKKLKAKPKVARPSHIKKDKFKEEEYKKKL